METVKTDFCIIANRNAQKKRDQIARVDQAIESFKTLLIALALFSLLSLIVLLPVGFYLAGAVRPF